ncbi:MAG: CopG family transcriptional regulator [Gammaproteobacteria bacterium]
MQAQKISISLPNSMCDFIDHYQEAHNCKSRSDVINQALYLLQQTQLEACYKEANKEVDEGLEVTVFDGLEDETW